MPINVAPGEDAVAAGLSSHYEVTRTNMAPTPGGDISFWGIGDDAVPLNVGIERKTVQNLLSSQASGELADQLRRMSHHYGVVILLNLQEHLRRGKDGYVEVDHWVPHKVHYDALWNELQRWQANGVSIQLCETDGEAHRVASLYEMYQRQDTTTSRPRIKRAKASPITAVEGLGAKRMEGLLKGFTKLEGAREITKQILGTGAVYKRFWAAAKRRLTWGRSS